MIAVDTNILVYSHREESPWHARAAERVTSLAEGAAPWAIPWPCLHEFFAKVTHAAIFSPPTRADVALAFLGELLKSPSLVLLSETDSHFPRLSQLVRLCLDTMRGGAAVRLSRLGQFLPSTHIVIRQRRVFWHHSMVALVVDRTFALDHPSAGLTAVSGCSSAH